jgi:uncharacterized protein YfaT (DUF1175 family)
MVALEDAIRLHTCHWLEANMLAIQLHYPELCHTLLNELKANMRAIQPHALRWFFSQPPP